MSIDGFSPEPVKAYLLQLIAKTFLASTAIYEHKEGSLGVAIMREIIDTVPDECKKGLDELYETLKQCDSGQQKYTSEDVKSHYRKLTGYLNKTYFVEFHTGIVPSSSLPEKRPPPDSKPLPERTSSKV